MQEAYIVAGYRTAVTKSKKGGFRFYRPDDLAVDVIRGLMASVPQLEPKRVDDVIVGKAAIDDRLEDLDLLPGDLGAAQTANELLALAAEHAADDHFDPALAGLADYIHGDLNICEF